MTTGENGGRLRELVSAIERLSKGDFSARLSTTSRLDDLDAIAYGVNALADELSRTIDQLKRESDQRSRVEAELVVSERAQAKAEVEARMLRSARLASIGRMTASIGHEINNPLAYVKANLDYIHDELEELLPRDSGVITDLLAVLRETVEGTERIATSVRHLEIFARFEDEDETTPIDVRKALDSAVALMHNELRHRAKIVKDFSQVAPVRARESRLAQVLVNLLVSLARDMPDDGAEENTVRISVAPGASAGVEMRLAHTREGMLATRVQPTRAGDEPWATEIDLCRELVAEMNGELVARGHAGIDEVFTIMLPKARAPAITASAIARSVPEQTDEPSRPARILIIDDEHFVARALQRLLRQHEVTTADSGKRALEIVEDNNDFDVIFCDVMMPGMSGRDVFEALHATHPEIAERIVFMTGGAFTDRARTFLETSNNLILEKPFDSKKVTAVVRARIRS